MTKTLKPTSQQDFDLIALVYTLWQKKLIIIVFSAFMFIFGYYYSTIFNDKFETYIEILPISVAEEEKYYLLNSIGLVDDDRRKRLKEISDSFSELEGAFQLSNYENDSLSNDLIDQMLDTKSTIVSTEFTVTREKLLDMFIEDMVSGESLFKAFKQTDFMNKNSFETEDELDYAIKQEILNLKVIPPHTEYEIQEIASEDIRKNWSLQYTGSNIAAYIRALDLATVISSKKIQNDLNQAFYLNIDNLNTLNDFRIRDLNIIIENLKDNQKLDVARSINYLKGQAAIARALEIDIGVNNEQNAISMLNLTADKLKFNSSSSLNENRDYLRGYIELEKEIDLLESNQNEFSYNYEISQITNQLKFLKDNLLTTRLVGAFKNTPISKSDQFNAVKLDTSQMKISIIKKKKLAITLTFLILGFVLSSMVILIREEIINRFKD